MDKENINHINNLYLINYDENDEDYEDYEDYEDNFQEIKNNIIMAQKIIPEMLYPQSLININGKIGKYDCNILIDTGANTCIVFKSFLDSCGLNFIIDKNNKIKMEGLHSMEQSYGTLWFTEIKLKIKKKKYLDIPISAEIIDDYYLKKKIILNKDKFRMNPRFQIILGMNFLKKYKAIIDLNTMQIILNNKIKIKI